MRLSLLVPFFQHRVLLAAALALSGCGLALAQSAADNWPTKPVRLVVAFPAGGLADVLARMLAPQLSEALGQQVVIDNRGGRVATWRPSRWFATAAMATPSWPTCRPSSRPTP